METANELTTENMEIELPETMQPGEKQTAFVVDSEKAATWVLEKLARLENEKARVTAQAAQRIAEIDADLRGFHSRFDSELEAWAKGEAQQRRRKTITLLSGTLTFRTMPAKFVIVDNEAAFVNARTVCPDAIVEQTSVKLDTAAYLKFAEATGDLTGVEAQPEREAFKINVSPGKKKSDADE